MIETKETKTFAENLAAIAAGDETATTDLTLDLVPELLRFAKANGAKKPESLVQGILIDAMRNMDRFHGTQSELLSVLCRVISQYIAAESTSDDDQDKPSSQPLANAEPLQKKTDLKLDGALLRGVETVKATGLVIPKPRVNSRSASSLISRSGSKNSAVAPHRPDIGLRSPSVVIAAREELTKQPVPVQPGGANPTPGLRTSPGASTSAPAAPDGTPRPTTSPAPTTGYRDSLSWSRRLLLLAGLAVLLAPVALIF